MFDKNSDRFPIKKSCIYLAHCGISPLCAAAAQKEIEVAAAQRDSGALIFRRYDQILDELRLVAARLLKTSEENLAFVKNTSEGMGLIANGYPFAKGDQIISYVHEYPANHYPWRLQEQRGVELLLLPNRSTPGSAHADLPCAWSLADLEEMATPSTTMVALSHVQFTSGFAADLKPLGEFCHSRGIDLVIDAAQSLGCLALYPEDHHIAAVASSGWKWLLGPVGTGLLYTSSEFREKLQPVMVGAELMLQGADYLDHTWRPHASAKRFEYSTSPLSLAAALAAGIQDLFLQYGLEAIQEEVFRLQDLLLKNLDRSRYAPLQFPPENRSGILSVVCKDDLNALLQHLESKGIICSARGGYLRLAPHFYNTDEEMERAADILNAVPSFAP